MDHDPWHFCLLTFGCKVNQYESQSLREAWTTLCGLETDSPAVADVVVLNTCAVTANAVADARQAVRKLGREAPGVPIVIAGCASEVAREQLAALPGVLAVVGQDQKSRLLSGPPLRLFAEASHGVPFDAPLPFPTSPAEAAERTARRGKSFPPFRIEGFRRARPVLKVQDGCSHGCAYCIVPLTRGPARSRSPEECLAEVRRLLDAGYREIMLSGINLRQYAMRAEGCADFWDLVRLLDRRLAPEWRGRARFRISSVDPAQLDAKGLDCLAETSMVCPHLHLSLQSGSGAVLRAMRRGHYTPEALLDAVRSVTGFWPGMGLGADILMGFPGETAAHVAETLAVTEALPLSYAHVFPFSPRPGTVAATLPEQVEKAERQRRAALVRERVDAKRQAFWQAALGEERVLVALDCNEDPEAGELSGQHGVDARYIPCRLATPLRGSGHALIPARPLSVDAGGLVVEPCPESIFNNV